MITIEHRCDVCAYRMTTEVDFKSASRKVELDLARLDVNMARPPNGWSLTRARLLCFHCVAKEAAEAIAAMGSTELVEIVEHATEFRFGQFHVFRKIADGATSWAVQDESGKAYAADPDGYQPPRFELTRAEAIRIARELADGDDALELAKQDAAAGAPGP